MRVLANFVLPIALIAGAGFGASRLVLSAETTARQPQPAVAPLVRVRSVFAYEGAARVSGSGIVESAREATISSEVSGAIMSLSPGLVEGGRVLQGEALVRIDRRAYASAVAQARALVDEAKANLELEGNASESAQREWAAVGEMPGKGARRVAFRKPQLDVAAARLRSAQSALERARLDRGKTTIVAPFNATVLRESVEVGDVVAPGSSMATLVASDTVWARISLPVEALGLVWLPRGQTPGSAVTVTQALSSGHEVVRQGTVLRVAPALDPQSRTAQVIVGIDRPAELALGELPLLTGAFVRAEIEGRPLTAARVVPRDAVFEGSRVWAVDAEGTIHARQLSVAFSDDTQLVVTAGIDVGEDVVTTPLPTAVEGMTVRVEAVAAQDAGSGHE